MSRPVTLFTGQWADLPLADLAADLGAWASTAPSSLAGAIDRLRGSALDRVGRFRDGSGVGVKDALAFVRRTDFAPSVVAFDAAMQREGS